MKHPLKFYERAERRRQYLRENRPPWWPENEEWPPRDPRQWRRMGRHNPYFRRMGCMFLVFNIAGFAIFSTILGLILHSLGIVQISAQSFQFVFPLGAFLLIFIATAFLFATRNLRRVSGPLDELLEASEKVADGDFSVRVDERGPNAVRAMLRGFNSMAERLQVNDQQRRNMLADISHELRSPITIMQGNLEGMIDGVYSADLERLTSLYEETQVLSRLVNDLRTLSLAESGSLQLRREPTDLRQLVRDVVSGFESQVKEKEIRVVLELSDIETVEIDPLRIREVLTNLLGNALRYTPNQGEVKVGVAESGAGEERSVVVYVQDSGAGIQSADLGHIFDRFYKSSDSGGMGLGLSIAKYLVEAHGGKIWAESETRQGTKISFVLPARFGASP